MYKLRDVTCRLRNFALAAGLGLGLFTTSAIAGPIYDHSLDLYVGSGSVPAGPWGTIELAPTGSNVLVTVSLNPNIYFASTGAGHALTFDLTSGGSTLSPISISGLTSGFALVSTAAGSLHAGGSGYWDYAIDCTGCGNGGSAPHLATFSFTLQNASYTDFSDGSLTDTSKHPYSDNGYLFGSDLCFYNTQTQACSVTGVAVSDGKSGTVPEPLSLAVFGAGLAGAVSMRRRKRPLS